MPDNLCGGIRFNKMVGMDSRPAKEFPPRMFSCGYIRTFSVSLVTSNVDSHLKIAEFALQGRTLLKRCYIVNFLKNFLLTPLVFGIFSEKNLL